MNAKSPAIYILANKRNGSLYVGVTSDIIQRVYQHKHMLIKGHTQSYNIDKLVYYEQCDTMESAIQREKQIKNWKRQWKLTLIEERNPEWQDLYPSLL